MHTNTCSNDTDIMVHGRYGAVISELSPDEQEYDRTVVMEDDEDWGLEDILLSEDAAVGASPRISFVAIPL